ncbi:hypothetical protein K438DRAFT_1938434, partial [Mycena galopus ATCC 62051]
AERRVHVRRGQGGKECRRRGRGDPNTQGDTERAEERGAGVRGHACLGIQQHCANACGLEVVEEANTQRQQRVSFARIHRGESESSFDSSGGERPKEVASLSQSRGASELPQYTAWVLCAGRHWTVRSSRGSAGRLRDLGQKDRKNRSSHVL